MYWPFSGTSAGSGVRLLERRIRRLRRRKRAAVDAGTVEHADRARLLPQRSLPAVLGLPAADGRAFGQETLTHSGRPQPQNSSSGHSSPPFATRVARFVPVLDSSGSFSSTWSRAFFSRKKCR